MNRLAFIIFCLTVGCLAGRAEDTNATPLPPVLPGARYLKVNDSVQLHELSPVAYFRVLLGMKAPQRERLLAQRPVADRATILRKIAEYEALPPEVREARLNQTELRWILVNLMKTPPGQRENRLQALAPEQRIWVEARLRHWDQIPAAEQKAYLEKQDFISFYLHWQNASPVAQIDILNKLPAAKRESWTTEITRWQEMPEQARHQLCEQFGQLVDMSEGQREAAVSGFSEGERRQMENSLRAYARLAPAARRQCVQSFSRFATMSAAERAEFLRNAARWEEMTAEERRIWRRLVTDLPPMPPLPPEFNLTDPNALPPMPPKFTTTATRAPKNIYAGSLTN